jgi:hypothetical protein
MAMTVLTPWLVTMARSVTMNVRSWLWRQWVSRKRLLAVSESEGANVAAGYRMGIVLWLT